MNLNNLPDEVLTQILGGAGEHQDCLELSDYLKLSTVNRRLHLLVFPLLYRNLNIKLGARGEAEPSKTELFARNRLLREPQLGFHVRKLQIDCAYGQVKYGEDICLEILHTTPNLEALYLGYNLQSKSFIDQASNLLCSGPYRNLSTLDLSSKFCPCQIGRFLSIHGLHSLSLGYCSRMIEDDCEGHHMAPKTAPSENIGTSTVSNLSISSWEPSPSLSNILNLPKRLLKVAGRWRPSDLRYSPLSVSQFLFSHKDTLKIIDLAAYLDKEDEFDPQETDGTLADFSQFTALRELECDLEIVLPDNLSGPGIENFAERLPAQLERLTVRKLPRLISTYAHKTNSTKSMACLDKSLAFVRSLSRAAHQRRHLSSLRSITLHESSYLPGPLEGPYLRPKLKQMEWRNDEKTAWCERTPFPLAEVGMNLTAHLAFVVHGWIHEPKGSDAMKKLEEKDVRRLERLEAGINMDSDEVDSDEVEDDDSTEDELDTDESNY